MAPRGEKLGKSLAEMVESYLIITLFGGNFLN